MGELGKDRLKGARGGVGVVVASRGGSAVRGTSATLTRGRGKAKRGMGGGMSSVPFGEHVSLVSRVVVWCGGVVWWCGVVWCVCRLHHPARGAVPSRLPCRMALPGVSVGPGQRAPGVCAVRAAADAQQVDAAVHAHSHALRVHVCELIGGGVGRWCTPPCLACLGLWHDQRRVLNASW
jgi:hypothetical protein